MEVQYTWLPNAIYAFIIVGCKNGLSHDDEGTRREILAPRSQLMTNQMRLSFDVITTREKRSFNAQLGRVSSPHQLLDMRPTARRPKHRQRRHRPTLAVTTAARDRREHSCLHSSAAAAGGEAAGDKPIGDFSSGARNCSHNVEG